MPPLEASEVGITAGGENLAPDEATGVVSLGSYVNYWCPEQETSPGSPEDRQASCLFSKQIEVVE